MTLSTDFLITSHMVDPRELFAVSAKLLQAGEDFRFSVGPGLIMAEPNQGLDAWLSVYFSADLALVVKTDEDNPYAARDHFVRVNFDTGYSYKSSSGAGCSDFHAWLIFQLAQWADDRGLEYAWENEFTGEWFTDRSGLESFGNAEIGMPDVRLPSHIDGEPPAGRSYTLDDIELSL